jgi:hypothetical protein
MKRDLQLVRELLIFFEEKEKDIPVKIPPIEGRGNFEIMNHLVLMYEAGFLRCERIRSSTDPERVIEVLPFELTWHGHEFLQSIRDDNIWNKLNEQIVKPSASWTVTLVSEWLKNEIRQKIGI